MQGADGQPTTTDESFQTESLLAVSRTFALTIPTLPAALSRSVANGYLLCRIADTIEDDAGLTLEAKRGFAERFIELVEGTASAEAFAHDLSAALGPDVPPGERTLIAGTPAVLRILRSLPEVERRALARCVRTMARGMVEYQGMDTRGGLPDLAAMDRYCYFVAGVVGEMLTELFCERCPEMAARRKELMVLAVSFGQALQMTNILKDVWEDRARGACWLPRSLFRAEGVDLDAGADPASHPGYRSGLRLLIGIAHGHLNDALTYTLAIPPRERGMRRFCLWALGMAVMTLRRIHARLDYRNGGDVKISRATVRRVVQATSLSAGSNVMLRLMFALATRGLPSAAERARMPSTVAGNS